LCGIGSVAERVTDEQTDRQNEYRALLSCAIMTHNKHSKNAIAQNADPSYAENLSLEVSDSISKQT